MMGQSSGKGVTRRTALRVLGLSGVGALLAACQQPAAPAPTSAPAATAAPKPTTAPTTAPAPAPTTAPAATSAPAATTAPAANTGAWNDLVAAAKKEGALTIATYAGTGYRKVMDDFETAFAGIKVEQTGFQSSSRDYVPRLLQERQAGLYLWDVAVMPAPEMLIQVKPVGGLDPFKSLLIHPEVVDDKNWSDGFAGGFVDKDKQYSYGITRALSQTVWVDTDQVKDGQIKGWKDLLDPQWRGKILAGDPRTKGSGFNPATTLLLKTKDETSIKQLWKDTEATLSTDARQLTEFMVRGRYPVSIGAVSKPIFIDFQAQGFGNNLKVIRMPELDYLYSGSNLMHLINKAPHPNTAKLWMNWVLTKEGSTSFSKNVQDNSRRSDLAPFDPTTVPEKGVDYVLLDAEEVLDSIQRAQDLAKSYLN